MATLRITGRTRRASEGHCPFCGRFMPLTFHHLIPKKMHRRPRFKRRFDKQSLAQGIYLCRDCHDAIHRTYTELELASSFSTPEALAADPMLAKHFAWVSRQKRITI
ncbi:MAG: HNH endonuclease [Pseudomonadota bacterium]